MTLTLIGMHRIRMTSQNLTYIRGTATKTEIYIDVNFYWLILPIAAVVMAFVLLVVVIQQSRSYGILGWKSSQLETLRMLAPEPRATFVKNKAQGRKLKVKLSRTASNRWILAQVGNSETLICEGDTSPHSCET